MKRFLIIISMILGMVAIMSADEDMASSEKTMANKAGSLAIGAYMGGGINNGISAKYWIDKENAIDAVLSFASGDYEYTHFHADYLKHRYSLVKVEDGELPLYFGIGVFTESETRMYAETMTTNGVRVPVGFSYLLNDAPLDIYLEVAPTVVTGDIEGFYIAGGFGFRYSFDME